MNFNNVWAALGEPVSVFRYHPEDHHIGGSDASGIVWKVGEGVTRWKPGDEVVVHCNQASYEDVEVHGLDPLAAPSPYSVLIELSSQRGEGLRESMEQILAAGLEKGLVLDATIAESVEQAKTFWRIRELFGEMQGREGGSIKHDVSCLLYTSDAADD